MIMLSGPMNRPMPDTPPPDSTMVPGLQHAPEVAQRTVTHKVEHEVVAATRLGEILAGVVDHNVSAQRAREFRIAGAADSRQLHPYGLRQLDGERPHAAGRPLIKFALSRLQLACSHALVGDQRLRRLLEVGPR